MVKRVVVSVVEGAAIGGLVALVVAKLGLGWSRPEIVYGAAALTGIVTGLVAGKPFWASFAKLEAILKAIVGACLATAATYGIRKWLPSISLDLGPALGAGSIGDIPAVLLPTVAIAIALLLEIDDAVGPHATMGIRPTDSIGLESRTSEGSLAPTSHVDPAADGTDLSDPPESPRPDVTRRGG